MRRITTSESSGVCFLLATSLASESCSSGASWNGSGASALPVCVSAHPSSPSPTGSVAGLAGLAEGSVATGESVSGALTTSLAEIQPAPRLSAFSVSGPCSTCGGVLIAAGTGAVNC